MLLQTLLCFLLPLSLTRAAANPGSNSSTRQLSTLQDSLPQKALLGRQLIDYASKPRFGGYFIGKYAYSDQQGKHDGEGFSQRFIRAYVDGTILQDFTYRVQVQLSNSSFHMKDYFLEWKRWKAFSVRVGQFKRSFLFENPYNPWDVGCGDYSQIARQISGIGLKDGNVTNGGRDQGLQVQGDLLPSDKDGHRFIHYQLQVMNGQGINASDANGRKDFLGTLQLQPIKDLYIGIFGWTGTYMSYDKTHRWAASLKYEHSDWTVRAEYAHSKGYSVTDYDESAGTCLGTGRADGWYATVGVPCTPWLKVYAKYDVYRKQATWDSMKSIYSIIPNLQIHKNLLMQLQYNHVHDRNLAQPAYNELWAELYVRF